MAAVMNIVFALLIVYSCFGGSRTVDGFQFLCPLQQSHNRVTSANKSSSTSLRSWIGKVDSAADNGEDDDDLDVSSLEIVLFGVGDFRTDDHGGLQQALKQVQKNDESRILPLVVLDETTLSNLPGVVTHSMDTSNMLHFALQDLKDQLEQEYELPLYVMFDTENDKNKNNKKQCSYTNLSDALLQGVIRPLIEDSASLVSPSSNIRIHVCDLGAADNSMGYGPFGSLFRTTGLADFQKVNIKPWSCNLWDDPWDNLHILPKSYPEFETAYSSNIATPSQPQPNINIISNLNKGRKMVDLVTPSKAMGELKGVSTETPTSHQICKWIQSAFDIDDGRCEADRNTGLFATHWGGLDPRTVGEKHVLEKLKVYTEECQQDDEKFVKKKLHTLDQYCERNIRSLEHASMVWNMKGEASGSTGTSSKQESTSTSFPILTGNIMAGEVMTRFLAAPLLLGTISQRRLWHACQDGPNKQDNDILGSLLGLVRYQIKGKKTPLQSMVEAREWHKLLAARNIETDSTYSPTAIDDPNELTYKYWRWHGFLCRYARSSSLDETSMLSSDSSVNGEADKPGILFVHGFGASGTQWLKTIRELNSAELSGMSGNTDSLAPDLIGFGHSEKPPITYSGYTWEAYVGDFVREVGLFKNSWSDYVVGGNSIGGFTAMCSAANDATTATMKTATDGSSKDVVSGSGASGTGRCSGVVLMNPAGNIQTKEEVEEILKASMDAEVVTNIPGLESGVRLPSVAQVTASDSLPPCKPLYRPLTRVIGNGLLWYLRPQIASICQNLYPTNPSAVDDNLVDNILRDSLDPGAVYVMMSGTKLPPSRTYNELVAADFGQSFDAKNQFLESQYDGPILMAQGVLDPLNDASGRAKSLGSLRSNIDIDPIQGGHCPHDELPEAVASSIANWLHKVRANRLDRIVATSKKNLETPFA